VCVCVPGVAVVGDDLIDTKAVRQHIALNVFDRVLRQVVGHDVGQPRNLVKVAHSTQTRRRERFEDGDGNFLGRGTFELARLDILLVQLCKLLDARDAQVAVELLDRVVEHLVGRRGEEDLGLAFGHRRKLCTACLSVILTCACMT